MASDMMLVLSGATIAILSSFAFNPFKKGSFHLFGKFRTKEWALVYYIGITYIFGKITPFIENKWSEFVGSYQLSDIGLAGLSIVTGTVAIHRLVERWKLSNAMELIIFGISLFVLDLIRFDFYLF